MRLCSSTSRTAGVFLTALAGTMVTDPTYDRKTGSWRLNMPEGCGSLEHLPHVGSTKLHSNDGVLPALPDGSHLELFEDGSIDGGVGGRVWRGSGFLCQYLRDHPELVRGAQVLELGAGTGVSGLYAAFSGASHVVLTDGGPSEVVDVIAVNIERHAPRFPVGTSAAAGAYRFGEEPLPVGAFEVVIGSDITYSVREERDALCQTLVPLLQSGSRVVMAHEHRRSTMFDIDTILENQPAALWQENDYALQIFLAAADDAGLQVAPVCTRPGERALGDDGAVYMSLDLSILEVTLAPSVEV